MQLSLRLVVMALMLVTAAALGMIGLQLTRPARVAAPAEQVAATPAPTLSSYLVAAHALPAGTLARDDDFNIKAVPPSQLPPGAITDIPEARISLRGALIRDYIEPGQAITQGDVLRPRDRGFLASVLGAGLRAVSIGVDPVSGVAGLIWPGDRVDVLLTQEMAKVPAGRGVLSETILSNVRVIGIDQEIVQGAPVGGSSAGKLARTVTLEVTPQQAEEVTVAMQLGHLALDIRAVKDGPDPASDTHGITFGSDVSPALSQTDQPVGQSVQLIEGDKRNEVTFR